MEIQVNNQEKPKSTLEGDKCPFCHRGVLRLKLDEHRVELPNKPAFSIDVWMDRCDECDEVVFPPESSEYIEKEVERRYKRKK